MNWSRGVLFIGLLLVSISCTSEKERGVDMEDVEEKIPVQSEYLIGVDELREVMNDSSIVLVDFRDSISYQEGHVPGAINLSRKDITVTKGNIKGLIASKERIEKVLGQVGIDNLKKIIVYDDRGACDAARFWWTMLYYGFTNVQVMNSDISNWKSKGYPIDSSQVIHSVAEFRFEGGKNEKYFASRDDMVKALNDTGVIILDSRTQEEYNGELLKKGAFRSGRIPGSIHCDWANSVEYNSTMGFKGIKALRDQFEALGVKKNKEIIVYCQSGTRSAHSVFVLAELLGYKNVKNYDGSWIDWSSVDSLEIESDIKIDSIN